MNGKELSTKFSYGFGLLRIILSYVVITCHFYDGTGLAAFPEKIAVPVFVALSFWFVECSYRTKGVIISFMKVKRLLIPGILWGGILHSKLNIQNGS